MFLVADALVLQFMTSTVLWTVLPATMMIPAVITNTFCEKFWIRARSKPAKQIILLDKKSGLFSHIRNGIRGRGKQETSRNSSN